MVIIYGHLIFNDRMWSTGEENGKPPQYSCLENPMNSMKRQNDTILKEELPRLVGALLLFCGSEPPCHQDIQPPCTWSP